MKKLKELIIELIIRYKLHSRKIYNPDYDKFADDKIRFLYRGHIFDTIEQAEQMRTDKMIDQAMSILSWGGTVLVLVMDNSRTYYRIITTKEQLFGIKGQITLIAKEI